MHASSGQRVYIIQVQCAQPIFKSDHLSYIVWVLEIISLQPKKSATMKVLFNRYSSWDFNRMFDHIIKCLCNFSWMMHTLLSNRGDRSLTPTQELFKTPLMIFFTVPTFRITWQKRTETRFNRICVI